MMNSIYLLLCLYGLHLAAQCLSSRPSQIILAFIDSHRGLQYIWTAVQCDEQRPNDSRNFFENLQPFFDALGRIQPSYYPFALVEETSSHYITHNAELGSYLVLSSRSSGNESLEIIGDLGVFLLAGANPKPDKICLTVWVVDTFVRDKHSEIVKG